MKTLVIHPHDTTTTFLEPVYEQVADKRVIRGGITREELAVLVSSHDRIMMMGHGSPFGLLSVGRFPGSGMYIVDSTIAQWLKKKQNSVFIWCYAEKFVEAHDLEGWYSDMFISELTESAAVGMSDIRQAEVDQSNSVFGRVTSKHINLNSPAEICEKVKLEYGQLAIANRVAAYNNMRLGYKLDREIKINK